VRYHVLDDTSANYLLVSNQLRGHEKDKNPLAGVITRELPRNIRRQLSANFDFAKWTLRPEASPPLDSLAAQLIAAGGAVRIKVVGHTDHVGSHAANRTLGMARAIAVRDHLSRLGVPANLVDVRTEGEESPIATNETEAGRQLNRRVVIWSVP
jgi:outer membrane protein OmpA-like peptidoglycan-associated protein